MKKYLIPILDIISIIGGIIFISTTSYFENQGDSYTTAKGKFGAIIFLVGIACYIVVRQPSCQRLRQALHQ